MTTATTNFRPEEYIFIRAWGELHSWPETKIEDEQFYASKYGAPLDSIGLDLRCKSVSIHDALKYLNKLTRDFNVKYIEKKTGVKLI